jgi:hypothetical protein
MRQYKDKKRAEVLDFLYKELPKRHANLYFNINETDYLESIQSLQKALPDLESHEFNVRAAEIVASVGDAHTSVNIPVYYLCPLEFYWFSDGIYCINTSKPYERLLYKKITHIDGMPIELVIEALTRIISHENHSFLKSLLPKYLPAVELLYGLKIAHEVNGLTVAFLNEKEGQEECFVNSYPFREYMEQLQANRSIAPEDKLPLYRKKPGQNYWMEYIDDAKTLYFNYRACKETAGSSVEDFGKRLVALINTGDVGKLVIDMRNNTGGNSTLLDPFIDEIKKCGKINQTGKLFVILGRDTFSSALLNVYSLKNSTNAILVGEPSGGKPNCYGEVQRVTLKHSGFTMIYSTVYYHLIEDDFMPSLFPDVEKELTMQDYIDNRDPCMEYILKI